jgi:hypothetical protein
LTHLGLVSDSKQALASARKLHIRTLQDRG